MNYMAIAFGAVLGAFARYGIFVFLGEKHIGFPLRTFAVNIIGCFLIGLIAEYFAFKADTPIFVRLFFVTGFLGSFTTFSTFAMDSGALIERGAWGLGLLYSIGSVVFGIGAYFCALALARLFLR